MEVPAPVKLDSFRDKLVKASIFILDEFGYVPYDRDGINKMDIRSLQTTIYIGLNGSGFGGVY